MYFLLIIFILIHSSTSASYQCDRNSTCGCSSLSKVVLGRIVGGEQAQNNAWNWMISIQYKNIHMCGASLISSEFAVTAAHCFYDLVDDLNDWFIVSGTNYLKSKRSLNGQRRRILQLHFHPKYKAKYFNHDIALIRFAPLIIGSNSTSNIICLPDSKQDPFRTGTNLIALGWGDLYENSGKIQNALRQVTVKAVSTHSKDCRRAAIHNAQIKFCAGVRGGGKGKMELFR